MQQDLRQQTEEILREVYKDGYKKEEVIVIEDKESAIKLSEEERRGLNKLKEHIRTDPTITAVYIYELSRLSRRQLVLFSIRDFLIEHYIDPLVWSAAKELYEKFVVNKELLHKQLLKEIGTLSAKIDHLNRELSSIHDKMERVEERFIFGRLRKARAEELIAGLSVEQMEIETRLVELANESAMKQCQINDVLLSEEIDDEKLSLNEKIEIVKKVFYMVTVRKPSRKEKEVKLYNKINNEVLVYRVDCWCRSWQLISQSNRAENPPPKIPKSHETRIKNRTLLI